MRRSAAWKEVGYALVANGEWHRLIDVFTAVENHILLHRATRRQLGQHYPGETERTINRLKWQFFISHFVGEGRYKYEHNPPRTPGRRYHPFDRIRIKGGE